MCAAVPPDAVVIGDGGVTSEVVADRRQALTCRAVGGKPAPTITWQSPGAQAVDLGTTVEVEHVTPGLDGSGGAVSRLMLTPSRQDDGREFVCSAINAAMTEAMVVSTRLHVLCESFCYCSLSHVYILTISVECQISFVATVVPSLRFNDVK